MSDAEKMVMLTHMTNESNEDVLSMYLELARNTVLQKAYPFGDGTETLPSKYDSVHVEIAAYMLNKRGAEGETVHLENGVSRHYEDGAVPPSLLRRIVPFVGVFGNATDAPKS